MEKKNLFERLIASGMYTSELSKQINGKHIQLHNGITYASLNYFETDLS